MSTNTKEEPTEQGLNESSTDSSGVGGGLGGNPEDIKKALGEVVTTALFDSGLLEKIVEKQVEKKLASSGGGGSGAPSGDLTAHIESTVKTLLAGEDMKILIDDKFRAISLYLKSDVIPKTVKKVLQEEGQIAT